VLDKTAETIGPKVTDAAKRYSGNNLNCSSCHQKGTDGLPGTKFYSMPFNNVVNDYPNFRSRNMTIGTAADRVNGCMTRSMGDGRPLPVDSPGRCGASLLIMNGWRQEAKKTWR
jgi:cytochrome c